MVLSAELSEVLAPALVAGVMVALVHAPLGIEVLRRGIIFIDLAVAQIAGLGLVLANLIFEAPHEIFVQAAALSGALIAGLFFRRVENNSPEYQEAIIGCCFVVAAALTILAFANHPHGGDEMRHLLSGQLLFVTWEDLVKHFPIYVVILSVWFLKPAWRGGVAFYLLFSVAITSSVQLTGVYIVFSSLILPALAAVNSPRPHVVAWTVGVLAVVYGILISVVFDAPAGPVIVVSFVFSSTLTVIVRKLNIL